MCVLERRKKSGESKMYCCILSYTHYTHYIFFFIYTSGEVKYKVFEKIKRVMFSFRVMFSYFYLFILINKYYSHLIIIYILQGGNINYRYYIHHSYTVIFLFTILLLLLFLFFLYFLGIVYLFFINLVKSSSWK